METAPPKHPLALPCSVCNKRFTRPSILREHERSHTGEKPFSCDRDQCTTKFRRRNDLLRHQKSQHKDEKDHVCRGVLKNGGSWGCGAQFARADALKAHWSQKQKAGRDCREPFLEESKGVVVVDLEIVCDKCMKMCRGHAKFRMHLQSHVADCGDPPFPCACGLSFAFGDMRSRHSALFAPPVCGLGSGSGAHSGKIWPEWGCEQMFQSHELSADHLNSKSMECARELRDVEKKLAQELEREIHMHIKLESNLLSLHNTTRSDFTNQVPTSNVFRDEQLHTKTALEQLQPFERMASKNRERIQDVESQMESKRDNHLQVELPGSRTKEDIERTSRERVERRAHDDHLCWLFKSYITRFGHVSGQNLTRIHRTAQHDLQNNAPPLKASDLKSTNSEKN